MGLFLIAEVFFRHGLGEIDLLEELMIFSGAQRLAKRVKTLHVK